MPRRHPQAVDASLEYRPPENRGSSRFSVDDFRVVKWVVVRVFRVARRFSVCEKFVAIF